MAETMYGRKRSRAIRSVPVKLERMAMKKVGKRNKRKALAMLVIVFMLLALNGCGHKKEEAAIREVAQKYFDALKVGDQEGVYDCYLPVERQKRDAESGLLGFASKLILNVDISDVLSDLSLLFGDENTFAKYNYRAADVELDEDGRNAAVYVDAYEDRIWQGSLRVAMTKYDGSWYVIKGTMTEIDRASREMAAESGKEILLTYIWVPALIVVMLVVALIFIWLFIMPRGGRKRVTPDIMYADLSGGEMEQGDILCSCGTVNPAGIRTCMGCGKKIKRRR